MRIFHSTEKLSQPVFGEFHRYIYAGGLAFLVDFLVLYVCTSLLGINYLVSNVLGFSIGIMITYVLAIRWIFRYRKFKRAPVELALFTLFGLISLGSNELTIWLLVETVGLYYLTAKVVAAVVTFLFNFTMKKLFLFSNHPNRHLN